MPRVAIFVDVDDLRRFARQAFGAPANVRLSAMALAEAITADHAARQLVRVEMHAAARRSRTGRIDPFVLAEARAWKREDPRVAAPLSVGNARAGVPIAVALNAVMAVRRRECDIAVLAGHDSDLAPAVERIVQDAGPGHVEVVSWESAGFALAIPASRRVIRHRFGPESFSMIVTAAPDLFEGATIGASQVSDYRSTPTLGEDLEDERSVEVEPWATPHPASIGARGVSLMGPARVDVFVDYRDMVDAARAAFGADLAEAHFSPLTLAEGLARRRPVVAQRGELRRVFVHDARPRKAESRDGWVAVGARMNRWRAADDRVVIRSRPQRTLAGMQPAAKGVATSLALDAALSLANNHCDVAVIASGDADLVAAVRYLRKHYSPARVEIASWWTGDHRRSIPRSRVWHHRLGRSAWSEAQAAEQQAMP
jgi:uncharacterized LabA/DUF88 family protein